MRPTFGWGLAETEIKGKPMETVFKRAWVINGWRLVLESREVKKGKNKGKIQIKYKRGYNTKKAFVLPNAIMEV